MPEIVCILNNKRSKPPALVENSKYFNYKLTRKYGAIHDIFLPNSKYLHSGNNLSSLHGKTFKDFGVLCHFTGTQLLIVIIDATWNVNAC